MQKYLSLEWYMQQQNKYIILYIGFAVLLSITMYITEVLKDRFIDSQKEILLKEAQTHFKNQVTTRKWSSNFGGVYVKPTNGLKPNPYLEDNVLKTEDGQTLIKINPAWMTRQLSEISNLDNFSFRIVGTNPLNPNNVANEFETRALKHIINNKQSQYYELEDGDDFRFMSALVTVASCVPCHTEQDYQIGKIDGGISINLSTSNYNTVIQNIKNQILYLRILIIFLLLSITLLIHKQFRNNENLEDEVTSKVKEVLTTKTLLQEVLDTDHSFLMVAEGKKIILSNKAMLDFFNCSSLKEFIKKHSVISKFFIDVGDEQYLLPYIDDEHWVSYLNREQKDKELKVLMRKDNIDRYFKVHSRKITIDNKELYIIIFDEITQELQKIKALTNEASRDCLTKLFNRGKFNDVLSREISLCIATKSPLSIIFLDIDHFKVVNDTYGHDVGDYILIEIANILTSSVRQGDFVARWGGEEFVITLQSTTVDKATFLAEKIRKNIENFNFENGGKQTISLGVTQYIDQELQSEFTKRVDEALYEAKASGRNKVVTK